MSSLEEKLVSMGFILPPVRKFPSPNRRGCVVVGNVLYASGHGPHHPEMKIRAGKLGKELTVDDGQLAAKAAVLAILATIKGQVGSLDRIRRVIRIFGMVNAAPDFYEMPKVIDGASDLLLALFGPEYGCHARTAVGMASLPRNQAVEINGEFEIHTP